MLQVLPVPCFLYFYTIGDRYRHYVPHSWCFAYFCLTDYLPTIFHTASVWLTVALAAHRYVYVCHPAPAKRLCTMYNVLCVIGTIYFVAVVTQLWRFFEYHYLPVDVLPDGFLSSENGEFDGVVADEGGDDFVQWVANLTRSSDVADQRACYFVMSPPVRRNMNVLFNTYYWLRVIFVHIVPCTSLVLLNSQLIGAIRAAQRRRNQLLQRRADPECTAGTSSRLLRPDITSQTPAVSATGDDVRRARPHEPTTTRPRRVPEGSSTTMMSL